MTTQMGAQSLQSCIIMTCSLCLHFFGYECARAASITMLAAKNVGFGNEAIPLTIALGTPISGLVLYFYTKSIQSNGSRITLRISNVACLLILGALTYFSSDDMSGFMGKALIITLYSFRETYVSLLSTQQWAFIATSLDKSTSSYIVTFSGVVSVASALGGFAVEQLVKIGGVKSLLISSCLCIMGCCLLGDLAFHFRPHNQLFSAPMAVNTVHESVGTTTRSKSASDESLDKFDEAPLYEAPLSQKIEKKKRNFLMDSWTLMWRHPVLQILLVEGIVHQLCTNMLNLMFHNGLRKEVAENSVRAMLVGRFFATVNIVVCLLQIFVLPNILSQATLPRVLTKIPLIVMCAAALGVVRPGIISVMLGFGVIKVLEYSVMTAASEMIYVDMGHEVRYLGKELIRYFGHKMGKSAASLVLSGLVAHFDPSLATQSLWGASLSLCWGYSMYRLANHLWERNRNEDGFALFKTAASGSQVDLSSLKGGVDRVNNVKVNAVPAVQPEAISAVWTSKTSRTASKEHSGSATTEIVGSGNGDKEEPSKRNHSKDTAAIHHYVVESIDNVSSGGNRRVSRESAVSQGLDNGVGGRRIARDRNDMSFAASILKDDVCLNASVHTEHEESGTDSTFLPYQRTSSWDSQRSLSSDAADNSDQSHVLVPRTADSPLNYVLETSMEGEDETVGGYGYEADAAWRKMYGGEDEDEEEMVNSELLRDRDDPISENVGRAVTRRRHTLSNTIDREKRTLSHESKLQRERMISNRVKTMSFDGELENSRPIMLRVGSMHVSLNTLEQASIARAKRKK